MPLAGTWYSNAPWTNTGYGTQTRQTVARMHADGHRIAIQANYGLEAAITDWNDHPVYPRGFDQWCNDMVEPAFKDWTGRHPDLPHVLFGLFDAWVMNAPILDQVPVVWWTPIDHTPAPPPVLEKIRRPNWTPVAMSKFGYQMMQEAGLDRAVYVPHAIDTNLYRPTEKVDRDGHQVTGRELMGNVSPDQFVVASFDANKAAAGLHRKAWTERLLAFALFARDKDDVVLYMHTEMLGAMGGYAMRDLLQAVGLPEHKVRWVPQWVYRMGIPDNVMAALYTAADVVLMPSYGEGFGLVAAEAQAAGARVILNTCTAQTELCGPDSWLVGGQPIWDPGMRSWWLIPNVRDIADRLEDAYAAPRGPSKANRRFIQAEYDADTVYREHWRPLLLRLAEEYTP